MNYQKKPIGFLLNIRTKIRGIILSFHMNPGGKQLCYLAAAKGGDRTWATVKESHNTFPINLLISILNLINIELRNRKKEKPACLHISG